MPKTLTREICAQSAFDPIVPGQAPPGARLVVCRGCRLVYALPPERPGKPPQGRIEAPAPPDLKRYGPKTT